ncbi:AEC family transporter [Nioella ostreopsis]|uniref:AEC family transporter n=1 Tax=Nioella ostreopsis TaxID=2448479 RepID=UPI000FDA0908|nr:AEC family transporter [Nioella ostreopsis]
MATILTITLPIYLLIGLGFLSVRTGYFAGSDIKAIGTFVVRFALPALIFLAVGTATPSETLHWGLFAAYLSASLALFAVCILVGRLVFRARWSMLGVVGLGMVGSNSAFVGFPLLSILYPDLAVTIFATVMLLENVILIPLALAVADAGERSASTPLQGFLKGLKGLIKNPLVLSIIVALAYSLSGLTLPEPILRPIEMLRPIASPIALFAVGGTVAAATLASARDMAAPMGVILVGKLVLHPLFFLIATMLLPALPPDIRHAGLINAACPMLSIFPLIAMAYGRELLASTALMVTTAASFVTISGLLWIISLAAS